MIPGIDINAIIQNQGMVATILLIQTLMFWKFLNRLQSKNCELTRFVMTCLEKELEEDRIKDECMRRGFVPGPAQGPVEREVNPASGG